MHSSGLGNCSLLHVCRGLWEMCFCLVDRLHHPGLPASWTWLSFFSGSDITGIGWWMGEPSMKMRGHTAIPHYSSVGASPPRPPNWQESIVSLSLTFRASKMSMKGFLEPTWITEYGQPSTRFWILCQETYLSSFTGTVVLLGKVISQNVLHFFYWNWHQPMHCQGHVCCTSLIYRPPRQFRFIPGWSEGAWGSHSSLQLEGCLLFIRGDAVPLCYLQIGNRLWLSQGHTSNKHQSGCHSLGLSLSYFNVLSIKPCCILIADFSYLIIGKRKGLLSKCNKMLLSEAMM